MCGDYLKKKDKTIYNYILKEAGIEISPVLEHLILNPTKISALNNIALEQIVNEYAPIYQKYRYVIDGPRELNRIAVFEMFLLGRLTNKIELQKVLDGESPSPK